MAKGFTPTYDHPLLTQARACTVCAVLPAPGSQPHLPHSPRVYRSPHQSGTPAGWAHLSSVAWDDPSGRRLREWLGVTDDEFFRTPTFAVLPIGFCYPGKGKGGDLPPRPECAPLWQDPLLSLMPNLKLKVLIGAYSQAHYLGDRRKKTLTETVRNYQEYLPEYFPVPHPSPRNGIYLRRNSWFEAENIPHLQELVADAKRPTP